MPLHLLPLLFCLQQPAPLLNYQDLQDLKQRLARQLVEVEVTLRVSPGEDPSVAPVLTGQAVCISEEEVSFARPGRSHAKSDDGASAWIAADPSPSDGTTGDSAPSAWVTADPSPSDETAGNTPPSAWVTADPSPSDASDFHIVASRFLVENAASIRIRTAGHPEWVEAVAGPVDGPVPLVLLTARDLPACTRTRLAPLKLQAPGVYVFSVDDPVSSMPNVFFGELGQRAQAPLAGYLLSSMGLPMSGPLFSSDGRLVAINLRRYVPGSPLNLSVPAALVRRFLLPSRRDAGPEHARHRRPPLGIERRPDAPPSSPPSDPLNP